MIIFLYGQNTFASQQKLQDMKTKFVKDVDKEGNSIKIIDGLSTSAQEVFQSLSDGSLFSSKKLIIIKNISANKDKNIFKSLRDYFKKEEKSENENIIIFIDEHSGEKMGRNVLWQYLLKQRFVQSFHPLDTAQLNNWIANRAEELDMTLSFNQVAKIASNFSGNLWQTDSELKKIAYYRRGLKEDRSKNEKIVIKDEDLNNMPNGKINENIFALSDAIANRNKKLALSLLEKELDAKMAETYLLHMIVRQFRILLQVRQALDTGLGKEQMASVLKLHPYVLQKSMQQAGSFSLNFLKDIFLKLIEIDKNIKTGKAEFKVSMELLITKL